MNTELQRAVQRLYEWWQVPEGLLPLELADGFTYDSGLETMNSEEWLWWLGKIRSGSTLLSWPFRKPVPEAIWYSKQPTL